MTIRDIIPEKDWPTIRGWWERHGAIPVPEMLLPRGYIAEEAGEEIACCFLYLDVDGRFSLVEYLTTNPAFSFSKVTVHAFRALLAHVEKVTLERGCSCVFSMVAPGTSEERMLSKMGYATSPGPAHRMYGKAIQVEALCP